MNTSFNLVLNKNVITFDIITAVSSVTDKKVICNGPASLNTLSGELIQLITIIDCTKSEFNKLKNKATLKSLFKSKVA